jgi:hypothetical protein
MDKETLRQLGIMAASPSAGVTKEEAIALREKIKTYVEPDVLQAFDMGIETLPTALPLLVNILAVSAAKTRLKTLVIK